MNKDESVKNGWHFPTISFPTYEDMEDMIPANIWPSVYFLKGLTVSDDGKNVYVEASLPGVDPNDIEVTFSNGLLTIRGEKREETKGKTYHRKATDSFLYKLTPPDIDIKVEPEAICKNGTMTVTFAKLPESKAKKIPVKTVL